MVTTKFALFVPLAFPPLVLASIGGLREELLTGYGASRPLVAEHPKVPRGDDYGLYLPPLKIDVSLKAGEQQATYNIVGASLHTGVDPKECVSLQAGGYGACGSVRSAREIARLYCLNAWAISGEKEAATCVAHIRSQIEAYRSAERKLASFHLARQLLADGAHGGDRAGIAKVLRRLVEMGESPSAGTAAAAAAKTPALISEYTFVLDKPGVGKFESKSSRAEWSVAEWKARSFEHLSLPVFGRWNDGKFGSHVELDWQATMGACLSLLSGASAREKGWTRFAHILNFMPAAEKSLASYAASLTRGIWAPKDAEVGLPLSSSLLLPRRSLPWWDNDHDAAAGTMHKSRDRDGSEIAEIRDLYSRYAYNLLRVRRDARQFCAALQQRDRMEGGTGQNVCRHVIVF